MKRVFSIIANKSYGLYYSEVLSKTPTLEGLLTVEVLDCRHICHWQGKKGGITSLAKYGLCGPNAKESRVGAAVVGVSILCGVVNIFPCSEEASETFDRIAVK